jgi:amino acid adenylation domain-containing protein
VLLAEEDESREKNLYAYIVTNHRLAVAQLREYLSRTLPDYMIPSYFRQLEQIPLTGNGKVDRKALPGLGAEVAEVNYRPPRDHLEEKLAAIWSDVLKIPKNKIGIDHNFFHLGGHSLKATTLVSKIHKELEVNVPLVRVFETRSIRKLSGYIRGAAPDKFTPIEPVEKKEYYPLSSAQQRLYMLQQLQLESIGYNMPFCYVLEKEPETGELKEIFRKLIHRHESLRTSFEIVANVPVQRIHTEVPFDIERLDSTAGSLPGAADPREGVDSIIEDFIRPFDLSQAPLLRVGLTVLPGESLANRCLLLVDIHHISADGKSHLILLNDYQSFGRGNQLPGLRLQYKDYARWQNRQNEKETIKKQEAFWLNEFSGEIPVLDLPGDYTRPLIQSFEGNHVDFRVGKEMAAVFKKLLLQEGATLFMGVLAVFNIFLFKVSNQEDIVIGSPVAARRHADLEQVIGMFVNTLALRNFPTAAKTFMEFLREIKTRSLQALENQEFPFEDLVDRLNVKRDVGRNPLFDVMLTFGNIDGPGIAEGMNRTGTASGLKTYELDAHIVKFDMMLFAAESGEELLFPLAYCSKLFKPGTADRFKRVFNTIFTAIIADPGQRISGIEIIAEDERKLILHDFNRTTARYPRHKTVDELFVEQVYKNPAKIAVSCENHSITYNELDNRSGTLAALLRSKGVHHEAVVGVMMENTAERITGLIAVLKAGGAYLPIDRQYPGKRKKYMMKDGNVGILLSDDKVPVSSEIQIINPGDSMIYANKKENPRGKDHRFNSLAYIIYTSGSTGIPKGVMVQHRCVVRLVKNTNFITFDNNERILQTGALEFDASTFEIWGSLLNGLVLHLAAKEKILDANVFKDIIARCKISTIWLTSSLFNQFVEVGIDIFSGLKNLLVGGEALSPLHINRIKTKFPGLKVINGYGPTENTTFSTTYTINKKYNQRIPIGKPINNSSAFILSGYDNFQPIGVSGELCVGGDGVARGYLNDVSLTARRFTMSPDVAGERIYRTGDQARWKPDGNIDFLGRFDFQVKIRGFRVEPEEIENQLLTHEKIKEAAVLVRETDGKHLYAYIVPLVSQPDSAGEFDISELKAHLSKQLPAYMIPDYFILLEKMPLTKNGKLDRKILSEMGTKLAANVEYVAPKTNLQKIIAESWKQVLTLPKVGMNDNFFDIGGNSFNIITLSFHLKKLLRKEISIAKIFQYPTIALFAEYLDTEKDDNMENISKKEDHSQVQLENVKNRIKQKRKRRR